MDKAMNPEPSKQKMVPPRGEFEQSKIQANKIEDELKTARIKKTERLKALRLGRDQADKRY
jgi:hypothetical protein